MDNSDVKLRVEGVNKSFPGVKALSDVSFAVRRGTVHALCGENGAGKSTLMKIINGLHEPDSGEIFIDGQPVKIRNPIHAREHGMAMISQELNYVPHMSVAESFFMGRMPMKGPKIDWRYIRAEASRILAEEGLDYSIDQKLSTLTVSDIQMLEIVRAVYHKADIVIMDEPTSAIAQREVEVLFEKIRRLKEEGVAVVYISHKMDEVFRLADEVTVLRDGTVVSTDPADTLDLETVIARMVGRKLENQFPKEDVPLGGQVLQVSDLRSKDTFTDINLEVRHCEIVGLAGLVGAGRSEVVRALFGLDPIDGGSVEVEGKPVTIRSPEQAIRAGLAMLTEDRRVSGIVPVLSVRTNATLAALKRIIYGGRLHSGEETSMVREYFQAMSVKTPTLDTPIGSLSGGNQQKVLLAKWMLTEPKVLLLDEPTRGIDVGAKAEIYRLITDLVKQDKGVLMISSELPELIGMCDRIYVMAQGRLTGMLTRPEFSQERILELAMRGLD